MLQIHLKIHLTQLDATPQLDTALDLIKIVAPKFAIVTTDDLKSAKIKQVVKKRIKYVSECVSEQAISFTPSRENVSKFYNLCI